MEAFNYQSSAFFTREDTGLTMPPFRHDLLHGETKKREDLSDIDTWVWTQASGVQHPCSPNEIDLPTYSNLAPQLGLPITQATPWNHSKNTTDAYPVVDAAPQPPQSQRLSSLINAQSKFQPTWHGFLETTTDAMIIVEAVLQGRLSCIRSRPSSKEQAERLTSGTVIVYEECASGIKRWTDGVNWSPSRAMKNYLIYRQLVSPKPKVRNANPIQFYGTKRKRGNTSGPTITKNGEDHRNSGHECDDVSFHGKLSEEPELTTAMDADFAESLDRHQQLRFCGSLVNSYSFKKGGLMKKTISIKYQGTHHHIISYYSLEDAAKNKLRRPYQDKQLVDIFPRPELLNGWKVNLNGEEDEGMSHVGDHEQNNPTGDLQHYSLDTVTQAMGHGLIQTNVSVQLPDYWHGPWAAHFAANHSSPHHYSPQKATQRYPAQQPLTQLSSFQTRYRPIVSRRLVTSELSKGHCPQAYSSPISLSPR
jgi:hypothetical protein